MNLDFSLSHSLSLLDGHPGRAALIALLVFLGAFVLVRLFVLVIVHRLRGFAERTRLRVPAILLQGIEEVPSWVWMLLSAFIASQLLPIPAGAERVLNGTVLVIVSYFAVRLAQRVLEETLLWGMPAVRRGEGDSLPSLIRFAIGFTLWTMGVLLILSNIGINVTSLIAGLGIGGIAVALAVQNILGDIFSSFSLYFDKPFKEGDFVVVGAHSGTVKRIGLKTTRLQSLQGEEIVISNQELTTTRVQNFKKMHDRRTELRLTIALDTPPETLRRIPDMLREAIEGRHEQLSFGRAHFREITELGHVFDAVYTLATDDFRAFVDTHQEILLRILERFGKEGVRVAVPVRRIEGATGGAGNKDA
jgi:small-conductance mechanosensitive channel